MRGLTFQPLFGKWLKLSNFQSRPGLARSLLSCTASSVKEDVMSEIKGGMAKTAVKAAAVVMALALNAEAQETPRMAPYLLESDGSTLLASADTGEVMRVSGSDVEVLASGFQGPSGLAFDGSGILVADQRGLWRIEPDVEVSLISQFSPAPSRATRYVSLAFGDEGLVWGVGQTRTLKLAHNLTGARFRFELSRDSGSTWETLGETGRNNFTWTANGPTTGRARIKVLAIKAGQVIASDTTDGDFAIVWFE